MSRPPHERLACDDSVPRELTRPGAALTVPRFAGIRTFGRLPTLESVRRANIAVLAAQFDEATNFRGGSGSGSAAIRGVSLLLRPYNEPLDVWIVGLASRSDLARVRASG